MAVKFVDGPPPGGVGRPVLYEEEAAELRGRPGEWALIADSAASSMASNIKYGTLKAFRPAGTFEAVCRKQKHGYGEIYARYVGEV